MDNSLCALPPRRPARRGWRTRLDHPKPLRMLPALLWLVLALIAFGSSLTTPAPVAAQGRGPILVVALDDLISQYSVGYLRRAVQEAEARRAEALVVRLSASGAVLREVRTVAAELVQAEVPIVVYVAPQGSRSGAAGSWLIASSHIAAMAPATSFGLAAPLVAPDPGLTETTRALIEDEAIEQLAGWQRERGRAEDWIEPAVRQGLVLTNEQASAGNPPVIDLVARDLDDLLVVLEGRTVTLANGEIRTLTTLGRTTEPLPPTLLEQILLLLANPTIAFLLLVMAGIAIYAELVTPAIGVLATLGVILLLTAFVGLIALPVNWIAVLGLMIAFALIGADLFLPSHGAVTVIGVVLLVVSAMSMFDQAQAPGVSVALWAVLLVAGGVAAFAVAGIYLAMRTRRKPVTTGQEGLVGRTAEVRRRLDPEGMVFVEGALWRATSEDGVIEVGELVQVVGVYELRLLVRRMTPG
ncbi:MAG: NfeD family protein [Oscillochloridaceae bacterium umkhey_bin13]